MTFKKGDKRPKNAGRKKGTPNKVTKEIRDHIKTILDATLPKALGWIMAIEDDKKRMDCLLGLLPYMIAKKTETQINGAEGIESVEIIIKKPSDDTKHK